MKFRGLTSRGVSTRIAQGSGKPSPAVRQPFSFTQTMAKDPALKGVKDGNCNITACQSPGAHFWNRVMNKYYCHHCAGDMHRFALRVGEETLFPNFDAELVEAREIRRAQVAPSGELA